MPTFDMPIFLALNATAQTPAPVLALARVASSWVPWVFAALLVLGLLHPRLRRGALVCVAGLLLTWCAVHAIRWALPMPRPAALGVGVQWVEHGLRPAFPSMHAAGSFAVARCLGSLAPRRVAVCAWLAALLVAWSRICLGVHFPSDVLAGAAVGAGCALAALVLAARLPRWRAALPTARGRS